MPRLAPSLPILRETLTPATMDTLGQRRAPLRSAGVLAELLGASASAGDGSVSVVTILQRRLVDLLGLGLTAIADPPQKPVQISGSLKARVTPPHRRAGRPADRARQLPVCRLRRSLRIGGASEGSTQKPSQ